MMGWSGLELVANSGDETLASKHYKSVGIEAYKSALRKAIEGNIENVKSVINELEENGKTGGYDWFEAKSTLHTLEHCLQLMDHVTPE
jgi:sensor domain CHASE-containing protein